MQLILGTLELTTISGVGTYTVTVAEQLGRMGHQVTIFTEESGEMAAIAEQRGLRVLSDPERLPSACDAIYAQDAPSAYLLADRYPGVPQAFCIHAPDHDRWLVPQVPGVTSATVTVAEPSARYAESLAHVPEVVRLRIPVDTRRFSPRGAIGRSPRRALALGNYSSGNRLELIRETFSEAGIELVQRGLQTGEFTASPEAEINDYDIVVGRSTVMVEAMACGRAAYVCDEYGSDGWVTPDRYPLLASDNFNGQAEARPIDGARLREDLLAYSASMGPANRELALAHHSARKHCEALVELFRRLAPRAQPTAPLEELGRITRVQWQADSRALGFEHEAKLLRAELARRNREQSQLQETIVAARRHAAEAEQRAAAAEREARRAREAPERLERGATWLRAAHRALAPLGRSISVLRRSRRASR